MELDTDQEMRSGHYNTSCQEDNASFTQFFILTLGAVFSTEIGLVVQADLNWPESIKCDVDLWESTLIDPGACPQVRLIDR